MLWFRKRSEDVPLPAVADAIVPAELPVALDPALFRHYLKAVTEAAQDWGGIEAYLAAASAKQQLFAELLAPERLTGLTLEDMERLLDRVFTARRRLYPVLESLGETRVREATHWLFTGPLPVAQRLQDFVDAMPGAGGMGREAVRAAAKMRRAAWDFAAEMLHFADPERYPLMARWVWDRATQSGALREFIRGNDAVPEIPLTNAPETYEGARAWLAGQLRGEGVYRDLPLWIDLVQAQAYVTYLRSVAEGSLGGDFGRGAQPHEHVRKLLGIEAERPDGRTRVKKNATQDTAARA